ncbi:MAG: DUF2318 domain-containing protein [Nitrospirae bacterium]|nr:MAG: DUF2318 domain-containing protein [Nitrospirota bacterium]
MSSSVIYEAFWVGLKEALKAGLVWIVLFSFLQVIDRKKLSGFFLYGILLALICPLYVFTLPVTPQLKELISRSIDTSFALFFILSAFLLAHGSGMNLLGAIERAFGKTVIAAPVLLLLSALYFAPDFAGNSVFLMELAEVKESPAAVYISATAGIVFGLAAFYAARKKIRVDFIGSFFGLPQLFLFIAMIKLLGGGIKGFSGISLIPSVQTGFMKFFHDFVHQVFVILMVPDHPLLKTTAWNFIGILFGPNFSSVAALAALLAIPMLFLSHSFLGPVPEPEAETPADRRKIKGLFMSDRKRKAVSVLLFVIFIVVAWFSESGENISKLYIPKPRPVVEDKGTVMIPLKDPTMDVRDGALYKFSLSYRGEEMRILVIKKDDGKLSVCLDACEICPPRGYGQKQGFVVCIYCNTPIPVATLGQPGGCNPIPLHVLIDDNFIRIDVSEILQKWDYVKSGKGKESVK